MRQLFRGARAEVVVVPLASVVDDLVLVELCEWFERRVARVVDDSSELLVFAIVRLLRVLFVRERENFDACVFRCSYRTRRHPPRWRPEDRLEDVVEVCS